MLDSPSTGAYLRQELQTDRSHLEAWGESMKLRVNHLLALAIGLGTSVVGLSAPASAASITRCTGQDGVVERSVKLVSSKFVTTHSDGILLGAGVAFNRSHTVAYEKQLSAGVTAETSVTGGADWKIAKLDATVSYGLSANASKTTTSSLTETFTVAAVNRPRNMLFAHGNYYATGSWYQLTCSRAPGIGTEYRGSVFSFQPTAWHGLFECNHSLYTSGSIMYQASVQAGC